jgi:hypothetical protein
MEDGGQIVNRSTGTITKGSDEVANPRLARVGNGNCGQGYSSEEVRSVDFFNPQPCCPILFCILLLGKKLMQFLFCNMLGFV